MMFELSKLTPGHQLPDNIIKFLNSTKKAIILPNQSLNESFWSKSKAISFDCLLIKTNENEWNIVDNKAIGEGAFGAVKQSRHKIVLKNDSADIVATDDVAKIQKLPSTQAERQAFLDCIKEEREGLNDNKIFSSQPLIDGDSVYFVMQNCGKSLDTCMPRRDRFDFDTSFTMAHRLLNDMFALKTKERIHRDLKPANICRKEIVSSKGTKSYQYCFIDFGLSRKNAQEEKFIAGTPLYMAPELLESSSSYESDVYALAGIFLEIFGASAMAYKGQAPDERAAILANYSTHGIFGGALFDKSVKLPDDVDRELLVDMEKLFKQMGHPNPTHRPTIEVIIKFFNGIPYRREANQINSLISKIIDIDRELGIPSSMETSTIEGHIKAINRVVEKNLALTDLYPTPVDRNTALGIKETHARLLAQSKTVLSQFTGRKFVGTNSTGISQIGQILAPTNKPIVKILEELRDLGRAKTKGTLSNWIKRHSIFGKGRHENVEDLYQQLAKIEIPANLIGADPSLFLKPILDSIENTFNNHPSFVFASSKQSH